MSGSSLDRAYVKKSGSSSGFRKSGPGRVFVGFLETRYITSQGLIVQFDIFRLGLNTSYISYIGLYSTHFGNVLFFSVHDLEHNKSTTISKALMSGIFFGF